MAESLRLEYPVDGDNGPIDQLTFRRPNAGDLRAMARHPEDDPAGATIVLVARLTGLTEDQVERIDGEDFLKASELAAGFLPQTDSAPTA